MLKSPRIIMAGQRGESSLNFDRKLEAALGG